MLRALIEVVVTIFLVIIARAILSSFLKGLSGASATAPPTPSPNQPDPSNKKRDLHKDPICGTYVPDTTAFQRQLGVQTFYYCSADCRQKHALVSQ